MQDLPLPVVAQERADTLTFRKSKQLLQVQQCHQPLLLLLSYSETFLVKVAMWSALLGTCARMPLDETNHFTAKRAPSTTQMHRGETRLLLALRR